MIYSEFYATFLIKICYFACTKPIQCTKMKNDTIQAMRGEVQGSFYADKYVIIDDASQLASLSGRRVGFMAIVLVRGGNVGLCADAREYALGEDDVFVLTPNAVLERVEVSEAAQVMCLCLSMDFASTFTAGEPRRADVALLMRRKPLIHLTPNSADNLSGCMWLLKCKAQEPESLLNDRIVSSLANASVCEFVSAMEPGAEQVGDYTSADAIFRRFLTLLDGQRPRCRRVDEYAHDLSITPKYLSSICKRKSGMTAIQVINKAVLRDIVDALRDDTKSVRQVAQELGFPNQSFFGTFLKKHMGMSPLQFRSQRIGRTRDAATR